MAKAVLAALVARGHALSEYEAAVFLPAVVERAGHNQDRLRALHRDVLRLACGVYPAARVADHLAQGLGSKSNRTKIECCEELAAIIDREGTAPILASRAKPMAAVAALLKERDGATRTAALLAIEAAWLQEGEAVWRLLGRLEARERDMVEEKLKRSSRMPAAAPAHVTRAAARPATALAGEEEQPQPGAFVPRAAPVTAAAAATPKQRPEDEVAVPSYTAPRAFTPPAAMETPLPPRPATSYAGSAAAAAGVPTPVPVARPFTSPLPGAGFSIADDAGFDERWEENLAGIGNSNVHEAVEAMKQLCSDIMQAAEGRASPRQRALMGTSAERMFATVNSQLLRIFSEAEREGALMGRPPSSRGCKYALNVMLQGMAVPEIARGLPQVGPGAGARAGTLPAPA